MTVRTRTRILHVTYDMGIGGTEQVIRQLVLGLPEERYENHVLCIDNQVGPLGEPLRAAGIICHVLDRQPGFDVPLIRAIRALCQQQAIDIVHCHQYTPYVYGVLSALFSRRAVVFTEHGRFHPDRASWKRRLVNPLLNLATDSVIAISAATRDALCHYEWFTRRSVQVIYNGIDAPAQEAAQAARDETRASLGLLPRHTVFGTISRFDSIKNQMMMIDALAQTLTTHPDNRLLLVGDGPERAALEARVAQLEVGEAVLFTGYQKQPWPFLQAIDCFLLTSLSEGTSMTLLEAMAARKACIVTAVGGNTELITHGEDGLVIASEDTAALSAAMAELIEKPALASQLATAAGNTFMQRFQIASMVAGYDRIYHQFREHRHA